MFLPAEVEITCYLRVITVIKSGTVRLKHPRRMIIKWYWHQIDLLKCKNEKGADILSAHVNVAMCKTKHFQAGVGGAPTETAGEAAVIRNLRLIPQAIYCVDRHATDLRQATRHNCYHCISCDDAIWQGVRDGHFLQVGLCFLGCLLHFCCL